MNPAAFNRFEGSNYSRTQGAARTYHWHMGLSQILMMVAMVLALGGYYWWKVGRRGGLGGYMNHKLGLNEGEQIQAMWTAYYDIDRTMGEKVGEIFGAGVRGTNIFVAITSNGRLSIGNNEKDVQAITFTKGQVRITPHEKKAEHGKLAGPNGLEKACVAQFVPNQGQPFRIQIAESGAQALFSWAQG